jgi:hypothetical protein
MMTNTDILELTKHPERLNTETLYELRTLIPRYPYFQTLRLLYLQNLYLLHDASFGAELRKAIPYITDREQLFRMIEGESPVIAPQHVVEAEVEEPVQPVEDRTLVLINHFLQTLPTDEKVPPLQQLDYSTDYAAYMLAEETPQASQPSTSLEVSDTPAEDASPASVPEDLDDSYFTETLAKIYIRQQRYEKALEIIRKLNLKYPKKSAYFADQIRFLEKLIINDKSNK